MTFFCWRYLKNNVGKKYSGSQREPKLFGYQHSSNYLLSTWSAEKMSEMSCFKYCFCKKIKNIGLVFFTLCLSTVLYFKCVNRCKSITNLHLPDNGPNHVPPNQQLFTHREPFCDFADCPSFLARLVTFFASAQWDERKKTWRGKRGKNIPLTQEIGTSCATAQCNHLSHLSISCPRHPPLHLVQQVVESCTLCFPADHCRPRWAGREEDEQD